MASPGKNGNANLGRRIDAWGHASPMKSKKE
jgi:hypothetical protein